MKKVLEDFKEKDFSFPVLNVDATDEENIAEWDKIINLLSRMNEDADCYKNVCLETVSKEIDKAKTEFFELFEKYFYLLWL